VTEAASGIGSAIRDGIMGAIRGLAAAVSGVMGTIGTAVGRAKSIVLGALRGAATWLVQTGRQIIGGLVSGLSAAFGLIAGKIAGIASTVRGAVAGAGTWLYQTGRDLIQGFINGMGSMLGAVADKAAEIFNSAKNTITSLGGIRSPSRVMIEIGKDFTIGLAIGMGKEIPRAVAAAAEAANAIVAKSQATLGNASERLGSALGKAFEVAGKVARKQTAAELELAALEAGRGGAAAVGLTAAEQALADRAALREKAAHETAVAEAQAQLAAARSTKQRLEAQAALDAALYDAETYALEQRAAQERAAAEAKAVTDTAAADAAYAKRKAELEATIALEQQHADAEEWLRQRAFQTSLSNLQTYLNSRGAKQSVANARIRKLMEAFGLTYANIGAAMGQNFAAAADASAVAASKAVGNLTAVVNDAIARLRASIAGKKGLKPGGATGAKLSGAARARALAEPDWLEPPMPFVSAPLAAGPTAQQALIVNVQIGDTELRDIVRYEVSRGNTSLAQALVAGGAR